MVDGCFRVELPDCPWNSNIQCLKALAAAVLLSCFHICAKLALFSRPSSEKLTQLTQKTESTVYKSRFKSYFNCNLFMSLYKKSCQRVYYD